MLAKELLDILACPGCKGTLTYKKEENQLLCNCGLNYEIIMDSIPDMLSSGLEPYWSNLHSYGSKEKNYMEAVKRGWNRNETAYEISKEFNKGLTILDIGGARGRNSLWLAEQGFKAILIEPDKKCVIDAKKRGEERKKEIKKAGGSFYVIIGVAGALPYLPLRDETADIVMFEGALHNIPNEYKASALREINRPMKLSEGVMIEKKLDASQKNRDMKYTVLYCSSHGDFGEPVPEDMYPIEKFEDFRKLQQKAGFEIQRISAHKPSSSGKSESFMWDGKFFKYKNIA